MNIGTRQRCVRYLTILAMHINYYNISYECDRGVFVIIQLFIHCIAMWYAISLSLVKRMGIRTSCGRG